MFTYKEIANGVSPQKMMCEECKKETLCYKVGHLYKSNDKLVYESKLCSECI